MRWRCPLPRMVTSDHAPVSSPPPTSTRAFGVYCVLRMLAHRLPSHISKTVPPTIHLGPPDLTKSRTFTLRFVLDLQSDPSPAPFGDGSP